MLNLSPAARIYIAIAPVDMRQGFNGLYTLVKSVLDLDPLSGHYFLFTNKTRTRVKMLLWDGSGLWILAKRLERGSFAWPTAEGKSLTLRPEELSLLLHGLEGARPRKWHRV